MRFAFTLVVCLVACTDPLDVGDKRPATPDEHARNTAWYHEVTACLGKPGQPERIRWWYVTSIRHPDLGPHVFGAQRGHDIYIIPPPGENLGSAERHEAQHHILWVRFGTPDPDHTHPRWNPCAAVPLPTSNTTEA